MSCRTVPREHIKKKCGDLENPITSGKQFDNTHDRIHGIRRDEGMKSENYDYGKSSNPADKLPKVGLRTANFEREVRI